MKQRFLTATLCAAVLAYAHVPAAAATLTGPMARYHTLPGNWVCTSSVTTPRGSHMKLTMRMSFDIVAPGVLHAHLTANDFDAHLYYGFDTRQRRYWANTANSDGTQLQQTSADGVFYSGSVVQRPAVHITDRFAFDGPRLTIHDVTSVPRGDVITDSVCGKL